VKPQGQIVFAAGGDKREAKKQRLLDLNRHKYFS
jgi:hypothetical protein